MQTMARGLAEAGVTDVAVPRVYEALTTRRVLVSAVGLSEGAVQQTENPWREIAPGAAGAPLILLYIHSACQHTAWAIEWSGTRSSACSCCR